MNNIQSDNPVIIPCPPLSDYKEQPADQSLCTAEPCPLCKKDMWLSEKKKACIQVAKSMEREVFVGCYRCVENAILTNEKLKNTLRKNGVKRI